MKNKQNEVSQDRGWLKWKGEQNNTAQRLYRECKKKHTEDNKAHRKHRHSEGMAMHWREASDGQEHWLMHWGWLKSDQACTQANDAGCIPSDQGHFSILIEKCFLGILSIQCKMRHDRPSDTRRSIGWCNRPVGPPGLFQRLKLHFFG